MLEMLLAQLGNAVGFFNTSVEMITFQVTGMTCGHCDTAIRNAIHALDIAAEVKIDRYNGLVEVISSASRVEMQSAIEEMGCRIVEAVSTE